METDVYQALGEKLSFTPSDYLPKILRSLISPEEAKLVLGLPATFNEIKDKMRMAEGEANQILEGLIKKGMVIPRTVEGVTRYSTTPRNVLQFHDSCGIYPSAPQEYYMLWREWREKEGTRLCQEWEKLPHAPMRVFPYRKAIRDEGGVIPSEDLTAIVNSSREIAVVNCVCRFLLRRCQKPLEVCMAFDRAAEYALRRGLGRKLGKEEALGLIDRCAEEGLVPSNMNETRVMAMCFCCKDCCIFLSYQLNDGYKLLSQSRYEAVVDMEPCTLCGKCEDICPFGAIEMKEKPNPQVLIHSEKCFGCGVCAMNCPTDALRLRLVRGAEHIPEVGFRY
jgi:ferredoxin